MNDTLRAICRLNMWNTGDDRLSPGYEHNSLEFQHDLRLVAALAAVAARGTTDNALSDMLAQAREERRQEGIEAVCVAVRNGKYDLIKSGPATDAEAAICGLAGKEEA